jgi:hypothetical protein
MHPVGHPHPSGQPKLAIALPGPTPPAVETWLGELPLANTGYCFDALLALLRALNAKPGLPAAIRLALADRIRPDVVMLAQRIEDQFLDAALPYPPDVAYAAWAGRELYRELGNLYSWSCPESRPLAALWRGGNQPCLTAAYRALQSWGLALLRTAQLYRAPDPAFWPDLYRVFREAEARRVLSIRFDDPEEPLACRTPLGQFKRVLLFAMADAGRHRQRDMRTAYQLLGELADEADLDLTPVLDQRHARFCLDPSRPHGPARLHPPVTPMPAERFLFIDRLLHHLLEKHPEQHDDLVGNATLRTRLRLYLAKSLFGAAHRRSERLPLRRECRLFVGFQDVLHAVCPAARRASGNDPAPPRQPPPRLELVPLDINAWDNCQPGERDPRNDAVIERILLDSWGCPQEDIWSEEEAGNGLEPFLADEGAACEIVNIDPHGYCVLWRDQGGHHVQTGALIGLAEERRFPHIGVVRWLMQGEDGLRLGIELLSPNAEPVQLWDGLGHVKGKGLLLPALPPLRSEPELLLPPSGFHGGALLQLAGKTVRACYRLGKIREATFCFTQFSLIPAPEQMELR